MRAVKFRFTCMEKDGAAVLSSYMGKSGSVAKERGRLRGSGRLTYDLCTAEHRPLGSLLYI